MRKLYIPVVDLIRPTLGALIGLALVGALLTFRLGILHEGVSAVEVPNIQVVQQHALSGKDILQENSLYLPHKIGLYALQKADLTSVRAIRSVGVVFGLLGTLAFYIVIRKWHTRRIAIMATALVASSSWFLYSARLAAPETAYLLVPWLVYFGIRIQENNLRFFGLGTIGFFVTLLLYIPGLVWFILPAALWQRRRIINELGHAGKTQAIVLATAVGLMLLPLALTFINNPGLIGDWLGFSGPRLGFIEFLKNLAGVPLQIFLRSDLDPATHVGQLPYLDIATTVFIALGVYRYSFGYGLDRTKMLAAGLLGGSLLAALNFQAAPILLPFLYILAAGGITFLLQQWFAVAFPRNPLARNIGVGLIIAVLAMTSLYHIRRYFIAWPNTPATRQAYSITSFTE